MNSVSEALSQAVPMIVIPQAVDQHLVGRQTANLGAAVVIEQEAFSAEALAAALARIEDNRAAFEAAATRLQGELSNVTPVSDAVNRALALISEEQSVA
jgi:UDP:flavonoid glycosyltransferase YjiC (YdhE family)